MKRNPTGVLVRISAVVGLVACLGVFATGLMEHDGRQLASSQPDPIAREFEQGNAAMREQRWGDAVAAFESVVEQRPDHGRAWFLLALSVHSSGDYERALALHERAAAFRQGEATALYNLACAHAMLGHTDEAIAALGRAADAGFTGVEHARKDSDLASVRADARFEQVMARMLSPDDTLLRFWLGEWDVYGAASGTRAGENSFTLRNGGLFILEQWRDSQGGTGESFNYFDPALGKWKQVWSDKNGLVEFVGTRQGAGVLFEGERVNAQSAKTRVRMHVRPVGQGRVRQTGSRWDEASQSWQTQYDLIYVPDGEAYEPDAAQEI